MKLVTMSRVQRIGCALFALLAFLAGIIVWIFEIEHNLGPTGDSRGILVMMVSVGTLLGALALIGKSPFK